MEKIIVYGVGKLYFDNQEHIKKTYDIVGYVDKLAQIDDMLIFREIDEVTCKYDKILIMVSTISSVFDIIHYLLACGIDAEDITLGFALYGTYKHDIDAYATSDGKIHIRKDEIDIAISTEDEFHNVADTLIMECYKYHLNSERREVVFDVGMNIGDAVLYFLEKEKVDKVYGFEPFLNTYSNALANLTKYMNGGKVEIFNYGLSDRDCRLKIPYNSNMSCGQSTINNINEIAIATYNEWGLLDEEQTHVEEIVVKKSSKVLSELMNKHNNVNFILKMDCEGEEYGIFKDLSDSGVLANFSCIMLEWHYKSEDILLSILKKNNFSFFSIKKSRNPELGLIYAWRSSVISGMI